MVIFALDRALAQRTTKIIDLPLSHWRSALGHVGQKYSFSYGGMTFHIVKFSGNF